MQAEAHADHLADALDVQKREMLRVQLRELDEMHEGATLAHRRELAAIMGHVRGLQVRVDPEDFERRTLGLQVDHGGWLLPFLSISSCRPNLLG